MAFAPKRAPIHRKREEAEAARIAAASGIHDVWLGRRNAAPIDVTIEPQGPGALFTFHTEAARVWLYNNLDWTQCAKIDFNADRLKTVKVYDSTSVSMLLGHVGRRGLRVKLDRFPIAIPPRREHYGPSVATKVQEMNAACRKVDLPGVSRDIETWPPVRKRQTFPIDVNWALGLVEPGLRTPAVDALFQARAMLRIYIQDDFTVARLIGTLSHIGVTRRGPEDAYDRLTGIKVAVNRLYEAIKADEGVR